MNYLIQRTIDNGEARHNQRQTKSREGSHSPNARRSIGRLPTKDASYQVKTKEVELVKVTRQVQEYKKEIEALQSKVGQISGVERLLQLEQEHKEALQTKQELIRKVK